MDQAVRDQIRNVDDRTRRMRILQRSPRAVVQDAKMLRGEIDALARLTARSHFAGLNASQPGWLHSVSRRGFQCSSVCTTQNAMKSAIRLPSSQKRAL